MCAPSADDVNARIRDFLRRRRHRPLTEPEQAEYEQLLTAWTEADRRERISRLDVVEVA